jgi:hypothetical protein
MAALSVCLQTDLIRQEVELQSVWSTDTLCLRFRIYEHFRIDISRTRNWVSSLPLQKESVSRQKLQIMETWDNGKHYAQENLAEFQERAPG